LSKGFSQHVDSKVTYLDNKIDTYFLKMGDATDNLTKLITKERDSELDFMIKNLTYSIKQVSLDKNDSSWLQGITTQLTEIISKTDRKNLALGLSNRLLRQEIEILRNSSSIFNSKLYTNFEINLKKLKSLSEDQEIKSKATHSNSCNLLNIMSRQINI